MSKFVEKLCGLIHNPNFKGLEFETFKLDMFGTDDKANQVVNFKEWSQSSKFIKFPKPLDFLAKI